MADDIQDPAGSGSSSDGAAGGGSSAISDPRDERLAALESYYERTQPLLNKWAPLEEDLAPIIDDDGFREFYRSSRKSYYQMVDEQKKTELEALPPDHRRLLDEIDKRLKPVTEEADVFRKDREARTARDTQAAKEATEKFTRENLEYAQRLVAEGKVTSEEVNDLGRFAKTLHDESVARGEPRFVPLEEAYKRTYGRAASKSVAPVPKSLRAKSGAPGVPGASKPDDSGRIDMRKPGSFTNEMLKRLNSQRKVS